MSIYAMVLASKTDRKPFSQFSIHVWLWVFPLMFHKYFNTCMKIADLNSPLNYCWLMVVNEGSCSEMARGKSYTGSTSRDNNLSIWPLREVGGAMAEVNNRKPHKNLWASQSIFVIEQQCFSYPPNKVQGPLLMKWRIFWASMWL